MRAPSACRSLPRRRIRTRSTAVLPREWVAGLLARAMERGLAFDWVNCGLCVDERGAAGSIEGTRRGTPADFWGMATGSVNTLVVATA